MTTPSATRPTRSTGRKLARFAGHYLGVALAMAVGMVVLDPLWPSGLMTSPDLHALVMATDMTIGMALWMGIRRHPGARIAEMSA
jgi:hypothetical protein